MDVAGSIEVVRRRIADACAASGRSVDEVRLMPVTKTVGVEAIRAAWTAGATTVGENRVQEAEIKAAELADTDLRWAVIGPLQSNKINKMIGFAAEFQALDREDLAAGIDRRLQQAGRGLDVLVQVNTSGEPQQSGVAVDEVLRFTSTLRAYASLNVIGLMTIAANSTDQARVAGCFDQLAGLRDRLRDRDGDGWTELSMGMSGDYELAVAHGSTVIRIGRAIFGARAQPTP